MGTDFACLLYRDILVNKLPSERVLDIVSQAVEIELEFVCNSIPVELIGINSRSMAEYIRFVADRLLVAVGNTAHYKAENPFEFMKMISLLGKTNFFEKRVGDYQKSGVLAST